MLVSAQTSAVSAEDVAFLQELITADWMSSAGDGNCFYHSIAAQIPGTTHSELRQLCCGYMSEHPQLSFVADDQSAREDERDSSWADRVSRQRIDKIYVDHFDIQVGTLSQFDSHIITNVYLFCRLLAICWTG